MNNFIKFLLNRGFTKEILKENILNIKKIFPEIKIINNQIHFPCYDSKFNVIWAKIRNINNTKIFGKKSLAKKWMKTGLIYKENDIQNCRKILLVEWETDYLVLKVLWFSWVVWNLWGANSNLDLISELSRNKWIISFYDNDEAWKKGNENIINKILFPIKIIKHKKDIKDVNDLLISWFSKKDFQEMINNSMLVDENLILIKDEENCKMKLLENFSKKQNQINSFSLIWIFGKENILEIAKEKMRNREQTSKFSSILQALMWNKDKVTEEEIETAKNRDLRGIIQWYWFEIIQNKIKCPFHWNWEEKTPSLMIYQDNSFYCHWCWTWTDSIKFVMNYENLEFTETVKKLIK